MPNVFRSAIIIAALAASVWAQPAEIAIERLLVLPRVGSSGRSPVFTDAVEHALVTGRWTLPADGEDVTRPDGTIQNWRPLEAGDDGVFRDRALAGGWAVATLEMASERVMILQAAGHRSVYVNGEPRAGDVYDLGITEVPILLREGSNTLLFRTGRGSLRARLVDAPTRATIDARDPTLPDVLLDEHEQLVAGVLVTNPTTEWLSGLRVVARVGEGESQETAVPPIPPLSSFKAPIRFSAEAHPRQERARLSLVLQDPAREALSTRTFDLAVRTSHQKHRRTFVSEIDGSVQYYAVTPPETEPETAPALVLTLHGASVEGAGQAAAYEPKPWAYVVAPTNRRPFGFDWEDWGRLDAIEVLDLAADRFRSDPTRTYLTGHSMGGHGTWIVGAYFPGRFAAIGPSAGWRDFWSYAAGPEPEPDTAVASTLWRASNASRTLLMEHNYASLGVYVLHGDADDNVPVGQARFMRERLGAFHPNFAYFEQPGAGHWWGNQCVDWPPMFEFFNRLSRRPSGEQRDIDFITVDPGISARSGWVTIEAQTLARAPSRITVSDRAPDGPVVITTENIDRAWVDLAARGHVGPVTVVVDGRELTAESAAVGLARSADGEWAVVGESELGDKGPLRSGPFKDAFRHRVLFVVGTAGDPDEDAWALAKARYDAEMFWYRGNGAVEIVTDTSFDALAEPERSVILYGNRDTNLAWNLLIGDSPITVERGGIHVGDRRVEGDGLACVFVRPRAGSNRASVGVVAGTGLPGLRLTNQLPYFVSGAHYPDWTILDCSMLIDPEGGRQGVVGCGFFAQDWSLGDDHAWRE